MRKPFESIAGCKDFVHAAVEGLNGSIVSVVDIPSFDNEGKAVDKSNLNEAVCCIVYAKGDGSLYSILIVRLNDEYYTR